MSAPLPPPPPLPDGLGGAQPAAPAVYQPPQRRGQDGLGIAGFVVALVGLVLGWGFLLPLPIVGLALSVRSVGRAGRTGLATAGKVLGIIGCCTGGLWWAIFLLALAAG